MKKKDNKNQQDLFGFDPKEKDLKIKEINRGIYKRNALEKEAREIKALKDYDQMLALRELKLIKIEKTVTDEIKVKTKAQEEEWFKRQKNQKDLF